MKHNNGTMMQYFEWNLLPDDHLYQQIIRESKHLNEIGISALWMPPAYKGSGGKYDTGYGVYDLYDLGEFDQKGSIATKYGTKAELLQAIDALHQNDIDVYGDIVLNHKMGGDDVESVKVHIVDDNNRNMIISDEIEIDAYTKFTFDNRHQKYSDFTWNCQHFDGVDYDARTGKSAKYLFSNKQWNQGVDVENGNFDYLMGADIDFNEREVIEELQRWGKWFLDTTKIDGLRLDAIKHIPYDFYRDYLLFLRDYSDKELFTVGEYWNGDERVEQRYLNDVGFEMSLFDVPLHYHFYDASHNNGNYDMSKILEGTLVNDDQFNAVTFVDNHDTQLGQSLQSWIPQWFKKHAYAIILLRKQGYPCVFYGDYYGIKDCDYLGIKDDLEKLLKIRINNNYGEMIDYFNDYNVIGWSVLDDDYHDGYVVIMTNKNSGSKLMQATPNISYQDIFNENNIVATNEDGFGEFRCDDGSCSVYVKINSIA